MVERLIEAGRKVLIAVGYESFTTNAVAAAADVSPGSLYQYFPDKFAIIDVVLDRWAREVSDRVSGVLSDAIAHPDEPDAPDQDVIRRVYDGLVAALEVDAALLRVAMEELPPGRFELPRRAVHSRVMDVFTAYLAGAYPHALTVPAPTVAWMLVTTAEGVATRWVLDRPEHLDREAVVDQLTAMSRAYLLAVLPASDGG